MSILPYLMQPQLGGAMAQRPSTMGPMRNDDPIARSLLGNWGDASPSTPGTYNPQAGGNPIERSLMGDPMAGASVPGTAPLGQSLTAKIAGMAPPMSLTEPQPRKSGAFGKDGIGWKIAGVIGDAMLGYAGRPPVYTPFMQDQLQAEVDAQRKERERLSPRLEQVGNTVGMVNPALGSFDPIYTSPSVAGQYALDRGFQPGTPEYQSAVADYRLGSWSDDALSAKERLEGVRYNYRDNLQDQRLDVTKRGQDIRSGDTRRGQDIRSGDTRRGQDINDKRIRASAGFQGRGGNAPRAVAANGQPIVVRGGKWVYEASGQPVQ